MTTCAISRASPTARDRRRGAPGLQRLGTSIPTARFVVLPGICSFFWVLKARPRDLSQWAKRMVEIATGEIEDREPTPEEQGKDAAAVALGRKGGRMRAQTLTPRRRRRSQKRLLSLDGQSRLFGIRQNSPRLLVLSSTGLTKPWQLPSFEAVKPGLRPLRRGKFGGTDVPPITNTVRGNKAKRYT